MATVSIRYFGVDGSGRNVTEAKRDAGAKIERAMSGHYNPTMLSDRGCVVLIWRTPDAWCYGFAADKGGAPRDRVQPVCTGFDTLAECDRKARFHLAQVIWEHADGETVPAYVRDERDRKELAWQAQWQARYKVANDQTSTGFRPGTANRQLSGGDLPAGATILRRAWNQSPLRRRRSMALRRPVRPAGTRRLLRLP